MRGGGAGGIGACEPRIEEEIIQFKNKKWGERGGGGVGISHDGEKSPKKKQNTFRDSVPIRFFKNFQRAITPQWDKNCGSAIFL